MARHGRGAQAAEAVGPRGSEDEMLRAGMLRKRLSRRYDIAS
jgi:hypothetical protein